MYFATIRQSSKYYNTQNTESPFPVELTTDANQARDGYIFAGGPGGFYRYEDLYLFVQIGSDLFRIKSSF
jgi:hypothetical protein